MSSDNGKPPFPLPVKDAASAPLRPSAALDEDRFAAPDGAPFLPHSLFRPERPDDDADPDTHDFPEDASSPTDGEADHSTADFDLNAEISAKLDPVRGANAPSAPGNSTAARERAKESRDDYFPEDERSSRDWEHDHSMTDFDLDAEIEAKLGKAPPSEFSSGPSPASGPEEDSAGSDPDSHPVSPDHPQDLYFPEDEPSSMDWEDDHSMTDFDLDSEVENTLAAKQAAASASAATTGKKEKSADAGADGAGRDEDYFPEDELSPMDWEDDHSAVDPDLKEEAASGPEEESGPGKKPGQTDEAGYVHPGLAASLSASLAYARHGLAPENEEDDARPDEPGDAGPSGNAGSDADAPEDAGEVRPAGGSANGPPPSDENTEEEDDEDEDDEDEANDEQDDPDRPMTLRDHLTELRKRVFRAFLWVIAGFIGCYPFAEKLFDLLMAPLIEKLPSASRLIFTSPPEAFFTYMKVAFVAGIFATSPLVFYQIWAFIAPGLYKEEKAYIIPIAFFSAFFFICGGAFCYFITFPFAFEFFMSYSTATIVAMPGLSETLSFVLQLLLAFGLIFELPLFVFFLSRLGIITADLMRRMRRYAVLINVIVAAILTPPDVMSQLLMAGPLLVLYEFSILIAAIFGKKKPVPAEEDEEDEDDDHEDDKKDNAGQDPLPASSGPDAPAPQ